MRRQLLLVFAIPHGACLHDNALTADDVIESLAVAATDGELVADGSTAINVQLCVPELDGRDTSVSATIRASAGRWAIAEGSDAKVTVVKMTSRCVTRGLIPPTEIGSMSVIATVADFSKETPVSLLAAKVTRVDPSVSGTLSATAGSMITVSAVLQVNAGMPTKGTDVGFLVEVEPTGAIGYLSDRLVRIGDSNMVRTTFFASPSITKATFVAVARPVGRDEVMSLAVTVER